METVKNLDERLNEVICGFYSFADGADYLEVLNELTSHYVATIRVKNLSNDHIDDVVFTAGKIGEFVTRLKEQMDVIIKAQLIDDWTAQFDANSKAEFFIKEKGLLKEFQDVV